MPSVALPSATVHYVESGSGVPVVLLHANPGDSLDFAAILPALAEKHRVLAIDWPGYGQSAVPERPGAVGADFLFTVLREFIAALDLPPAFFLGNSVGGNVAAKLAIAAPKTVLGLVLVSPGGFTPHNFFTRAFCRVQGSRFAFSPRFFAGLYLKRRTPVVAAMLERAATSQTSAARLAINRAVWRSFVAPEHDLRPLAGAITAPTLLVFGAHDPVIPAAKDGALAAQTIRGSRLVVLPCGHAPFAEVPERFLAEVLTFLSGLPA